MKFLSSVFLINVLAIFGGRQGAGKSMTTEQNGMTTQGQNTRKATTARSGKGYKSAAAALRRGLNDDDSSSSDSSADSSALIDNSTVFGGRLPAGDEAGAIPMRASCDCSWTSKYRCPGFAKKGVKNAGDDHSSCYDYCCGGLSQCLKCDKKRTLCTTTSDPAQCAKFRKNSIGLWKETKTGQCLDMFKKNRFGLWPCKKGRWPYVPKSLGLENQANEKVGEKYCFDWRGGKLCVEDTSQTIRIKDGNSKCLVCDQKDKLCGAPKSNIGECSDFERTSDGFFKVKGTDQCLDRYTAGWGLWKCKPMPDNHRFVSNLKEENIVFSSRGSRTTCVDTPGWTNGHTKCAAEKKGGDKSLCVPGSGWTCKQYAEDWCEYGAARWGMKWTLGSTFKKPEDNCCVCGKARVPW